MSHGSFLDIPVQLLSLLKILLRLVFTSALVLLIRFACVVGPFALCDAEVCDDNAALRRY